MADKRLNIAVLFHEGGSGLGYLIKNDPNFNKEYKLALCFTDNKDASGIHKFNGVTVLDYKNWCTNNKHRYTSLTEKRDLYFEEVFNTFFKNKDIDLIVLSGFMLRIPKSFLDRFSKRIINIHPADLRKLDENGERKYVGIGSDVIRRVIEDGHKKTFSVIHFVTEKFDDGEIICISRPLYVENRTPEEQQNLMKEKCDGPALQCALQLIIRGDIKIGE